MVFETLRLLGNQGSSNITSRIQIEKNLEEAANDVRDKVSQGIMKFTAR